MSNILAATIEVQQEEIAELREQLAAARLKTDEACKTVQVQFKRNGQLERRLAAVAALVPEAGLLERAAVYATAHSLASPGNIGRSQAPEDASQLRNLAYTIRAWRGDGDGGEGKAIP